MSITFKIGDIVQLRDGGELMTIETILGNKHDQAECTWGVGAQSQLKVFTLDSLVHVTPADAHKSNQAVSRYEEGLDPNDLTVQLSELLVATADMSDELIHHSVQEVLKIVLEKLKMHVVFVSEFVDGMRVIRQVECRDNVPILSAGQADPLEATWCQRIVDGRLPQIINDVQKLAQEIEIPKTHLKIGSYLATPIILSDGNVYGTFCCFSSKADDKLVERDLKNLQLAAKYAAEKLQLS